MSVVHIKSKAEFDSYIAQDKLTIVDFLQHGWCGPCKAIAPKIEEFAKAHTNVNFIKVDVDELEDVAAEEGIQAMPTFKAYKNGKKAAEDVVGANADKIKKIIDIHGKN